MKIRLSMLAFALAASLGSANAFATTAIEWVPGETNVTNGDLVSYQGECYVAQNNPGSWETPSDSSTWFWEPAACPDGTTNPTPDPDPTDDTNPNPNPDPIPDGIVTWVAGETKAANGDVVAHNGSCFEAQNSPGAWEEPKATSWFWTEVDCSIVITPDPDPTDDTNPNPDPTDDTNPNPLATFYVSPTGSDSNAGTAEAPFATIDKAVGKAAAGDVIDVANGRYQQSVMIDKVHGTAANPVIIQGHGAALIDGTIEIKTPWVQHNGHIYKTQISEDIWQLFVGDEAVVAARWPNAQYGDGSIWDMKSTWRHQKPESSFGTMIDGRPYEEIKVGSSGNTYTELPAGINAESLAQSGLDVTGAIAIMNIGSWLNWAQRVSSHTPGTDTFTYSTDFSGSGTAMSKAAQNMLADANFWATKNGKYEEGHYYLEGKLEFVDSPNEWFFDQATKTVYLWAPGNADPNSLQVRGKNQTYGLTVRNSSYVNISGLDFFGTAFTVISSEKISFTAIDAKYYAYSRRMLGELTRPATIKFINNNTAITETNNGIYSSRLSYTDGPAFELIKENGDIIDNNLIHDIDYSNLGTGGEGSLNMASQTKRVQFTNNTFHTAGNSEGVRVSAESIVTGNNIYNTSLLQHDGAAINVGVAEQAGTVIANNWVHDSPKAGIRFDGVNGSTKVGVDGVVHHNVVWNTEFSIIKGESQGTYNNLMFNNRITDLIIFNKQDAGGLNLYSETMNNLVGSLQGRKSGSEQDLMVPGVVSNNMTNGTGNILDNLVGPLWGDFRPKQGASIIDAGTTNTTYHTLSYQGALPDIGAYEYSEPTYLIPGHKGPVASNPVPFTEALEVPTSVELMFNAINDGSDYQVYLGTSPDSMNLIGTTTTGSVPVSGLTPATTYYWRVDNSAGGNGEVWSFTTGL